MRKTAAIIVAATLTASAAAAQEPDSRSAGEAAPADAAVEERINFTWRGLAHTLGGALVGGWVGYVAAQVSVDDWQKDTNSTFKNQRTLWAAAGALAGVVGSRVVGDTWSPEAPAASLYDFERDRDEIFEHEIRSAEAVSAYELVYTLRNEWLHTRGENSFSEMSQGHGGSNMQITITPGRDKIKVYLDDIAIGGVEDLQQVSADLLTGVRFLDPREATLRYGGGHAHGAILLLTEVSRR